MGGDARPQDHLGRPQGRLRDPLLANGKARQPRRPAPERIRGQLLPGEDQRRQRRLEPRGGDLRRLTSQLTMDSFGGTKGPGGCSAGRFANAWAKSAMVSSVARGRTSRSTIFNSLAGGDWLWLRTLAAKLIVKLSPT